MRRASWFAFGAVAAVALAAVPAVPAQAKGAGSGKVLVTVVGAPSGKVRVTLSGKVERRAKPGKLVRLPAGTYRVKAKPVRVKGKKLPPRGLPTRVTVRKGRTVGLNLLYGNTYLTKAKPTNARLTTGDAIQIPAGGSATVAGTRVEVPPQNDAALTVSARPLTAVAGLKGLTKPVGVVVDWPGQLSAPVKVVLPGKRGGVAFAAGPNGAQTHLYPGGKTLSVHRPGAYFTSPTALRSSLVVKGFAATMPSEPEAQIEHILASKGASRSAASSATLSGVAEQIEAQLQAEIDFINTYVAPRADQLTTSCAAAQLTLPALFGLERNLQLLGKESETLLSKIVASDTLTRIHENCMREISEPCVKASDASTDLGYYRSLLLLGGQPTAYMNEVANGIIDGSRICGGRLEGDLVFTKQGQGQSPGFYQWELDTSVTIHLAYRYEGIDPQGRFRGFAQASNTTDIDHLYKYRTFGNLCPGYDMTDEETASLRGLAGWPYALRISQPLAPFELSFEVDATRRWYGNGYGSSDLACIPIDETSTTSVQGYFTGRLEWNANHTALVPVDLDKDPMTTISGMLTVVE